VRFAGSGDREREGGREREMGGIDKADRNFKTKKNILANLHPSPHTRLIPSSPNPHSFIDRDNKASLRNLLRALRQESFVLERAWELEHEHDGNAAHQLEEEEEVLEEEEEAGRGGSGATTRRRSVVLMRGAKLLLLAPVAPEDVMVAQRQEMAEARWLPGVWDEPRARTSAGVTDGDSEEEEENEWAPPLLSDEE
jgi:hypothetical protein